MSFPENFDFESFFRRYNETGGDVKLAEKLKKEFGAYAPFLDELIRLRPKVEVKLPNFAEQFCLFTRRSFEQSSSEALAAFKSRRFVGALLLDLTGGLGVDDAAFSGSFRNVTSIDNDVTLNKIARYNFKRLGINNVERIDADAYEFVRQNEQKFDIAYIDSDRRTKNGKKKSVTLHDSEPAVLKVKDDIFKFCDNILLKLSPLIDLSYLIKVLPETQRVFVASFENEVKEILAHLNRSFSGIPAITAVNISPDGTEKEFSGTLNERYISQYTDTARYFYEPSAALIKSGLTLKYASLYDLRSIGKNSAYLLGNKLIKDFFGRGFEIIAKLEFGKSKVKKYLEENTIERANISKRDFPLPAAGISKLFGLRDGGDDYLFFTKDNNGRKIMFHTKKISNKAAAPSREKNR